MSTANLVRETAPWAKAIERAAQLSTNRVEYVWTYDDPGDGHRETLWRVSSATHEGERYAVRTSSEGWETRITCTCPAGQNGRRCWHTAAVLIRLGLLKPVGLPETKEAA